MEYKYARRMSEIKASEIRELLKLTEKPEVISFAGGLPAPELFPIEEIRAVNNYVLDRCGEQALQYTTTEGWQPLRKWIAERMNTQLGTSFCDENIMITHGSQQALDLSGKVFLDEGDVVLCESPTYLAAISAFKAYGCRFVEIDTDDEGMIPASLEKALKEYPAAKLIYIIPNFQNPTGKTWSLERRKQAAELSAKRIYLILINSHNAGDSHMIVRPTGRFVARKTNIERYSTVMLLHQPNIRFGEFVSQFTFCFFYHLFCRRCANIFIHSIFIIIPEVYKVKILKRFVFHNRCF